MSPYPNPPPIPDAPGLPPWVLAFAHMDGTGNWAAVFDGHAFSALCSCGLDGVAIPKYWVSTGPGGADTRHGEDCRPLRDWPLARKGRGVFAGDDEAKALAEYNKQAELLRHRDRLAEEEP